MTRSQLEAVHDTLVEIIDGWNDAAADEDRGRSNDFLILTIADDGSGMLGRRRPSFKGPDGQSVIDVEDWHDFKNADELLKVLTENEGVELERD